MRCGFGRGEQAEEPEAGRSPANPQNPKSQRSKTLILVETINLPPQVWGNLGAFLERLDEEWNGSLKVR